MKRVLITGGSGDIGRAIALRFASDGYMVAVNYNTNKNAADEVCLKIKEEGGTAISVQGDISDSSQAKNVVSEVMDRLGGIDVLVNNAGIALKQGLFTDFSEEEAERVFGTNVFGMMNCCRQVIPHFVKNKCGRIINVSSIWGISGASCEVIYSSSKSAVIGFTKALARELAPSGICVNCVAPGLIETQMNSHLTKEEKDEFIQGIPLGRAGLPSEVADAIAFFASEGSNYITGQVLTVDGGLL